MLVTMTPNSRIEPSFRLVSETSPGVKTVSVQLAPSPSMKRNRAGMLVMNVPIKRTSRKCVRFSEYPPDPLPVRLEPPAYPYLADTTSKPSSLGRNGDHQGC
jgi:hypothetical protein